jgi:hypothetical protein
MEERPMRRSRWQRAAAHSAAGVAFAALVWYLVVRIRLPGDVAGRSFDPSAVWYEVALGVLAAVATVVFVSPPGYARQRTGDRGRHRGRPARTAGVGRQP